MAWFAAIRQIHGPKGRLRSKLPRAWWARMNASCVTSSATSWRLTMRKRHGVDAPLVAPDDLLEGEEVPPRAFPRRSASAGSRTDSAARRTVSMGDTNGGPAVFRPPERKRAYSRTLITTRRFWARSSFVLLSATGFVFAVGDHLHAVEGDAVLVVEVVPDGRGPVLPELLVVLIGAGGVGVPLDLEEHATVLGLEAERWPRR